MRLLHFNTVGRVPAKQLNYLVHDKIADLKNSFQVVAELFLN